MWKAIQLQFPKLCNHCCWCLSGADRPIQMLHNIKWGSINSTDPDSRVSLLHLPLIAGWSSLALRVNARDTDLFCLWFVAAKGIVASTLGGSLPNRLFLAVIQVICGWDALAWSRSVNNSSKRTLIHYRRSPLITQCLGQLRSSFVLPHLAAAVNLYLSWMEEHK